MLPISGAAAQEREAATVAAGEQGVLVYPPAFFASSNPNTALDMVDRLPGFTIDGGDSGSRGLAGAGGNVLIDGALPTSKSDYLGDVLQRISAASVERIELIRGGAPGIDMRGRAVIANVVLKPAPKTEIVAEGNAYIYRDGAVGPSARLTWSRRAGERQSEVSVFGTEDRSGDTARGRRLRTDAAGVVLQDARIDLTDHLGDYSARGSIQRPLFGGKLRANAALESFRSRDTRAIIVTGGSGADEVTRERNARPSGELGFTWTRDGGPRSTLELTGLQQLNRSTYSGTFDSGGSTTTFTSRATGGESVLRLTDTFRPGTTLSIEGGGEVAYNFLDTRNRYIEDGIDVPLPSAAVRVSELRGEGFAQATWQPSPKLTVVGTFRVELSRIAETGDTRRSRSFVYPKPKLLLTWQPAAADQVRFRFEKKVGQLDFGDFAASSDIALGTVLGGNADLRPQRSTVYEAIYEHRFWKKGVLELTALHRDLADVVDTIPLAGGFDATGNIGNGTAEVVVARLTLPLDRIGVKDALLTLSASGVRSRVTDPLTGKRRRLNSDQPFECDATFSHDLKGGRFSYGIRHDCNIDRFTSYRTDEVRTTRYGPFFTIYGQWKPSQRLSVRLDASNLSNIRTQGFRDIYDGPRNTAPLLLHEVRTTRRGQYLFLQVRRVL